MWDISSASLVNKSVCPGLVWTVVSDFSGLTWSNRGRITIETDRIPDVSEYEIRVIASIGDFDSDPASFTLTVLDEYCIPPFIYTDFIYEVGQPDLVIDYSVANDCDWIFSSPDLPEGMTLNGAVLTITDAAVTGNFTIEAVEVDGPHTETRNITLTVSQPLPEIEGIPTSVTLNGEVETISLGTF